MRKILVLAALAVALLVVGCGASSTPQESQPTPTEQPVSPITQPSPAAKPAPPPASAGLQDGSLRVDTYKFEDAFGSFGGTARVTNVGDKQIETAGVTFTLLDASGNVVGTLSGMVPVLQPGETGTVQLVSADDYVKGDLKVEFQVDWEF